MYKKIYIFEVKRTAEKEICNLIDKNLRPLPRKSDGTFDTASTEFSDNDVDALRHAYVSGVFTIKYNVLVANVLGYVNEFRGNYGRNLRQQSNIRNMDLWNNHVGREYGKKSKNRKELFEYLIRALKNGELIVTPDDSRKYSHSENPIDASVIVLKESESGENQYFLDVKEMLVLSKEEFVAKIKNKYYGDEYEVRIVGGKEIPASKRDGKDNLG